LSKQLRKTISRVVQRRVQLKATSPDPKVFWKSIREISGKDIKEPELKIKNQEGIEITDSQVLAESFAQFFVTKAEKLSERTKKETIDCQWSPNEDSWLLISERMVLEAVNALKPKKSYGIDGVPLCVVKDVYNFIPHHYHRLLSMAAKKMPKIWKTARVIPLHKKGCRLQIDNYRPISNLCSIDKLFEKIILNEINRRHPGLEGSHQHGFRSSHSTTTAMMEVQDSVASYLDEGQRCVVYSVDLSAAFDLLRKNTFAKQMRGVMDPDLLNITMDFLSDRKMSVEVSGKSSRLHEVRLGCVQGSVLGPKLFNIYMRDVVNHTQGNKMVTYADDSYVIIPGYQRDEVTSCVKSHLGYLDSQGMITNLSKTEAVLFGGEQPDDTISLDGESFKLGKTMKVLGVVFDQNLKFSDPISRVLTKARKMNSAMKLVRKKLKLDQFMRVMTCQYYGRCFYGCPIWLNGTTSFMDLRRLNALHYRALRIARRDYKKELSRSDLDMMGRARPTTWSQYLMASATIKAITRETPPFLARESIKNLFIERRKPEMPKFYDDSKKKVGRQAIRNRLGHLNGLTFAWKNGISDDLLRINLKKHFKIF